MKDGLSWKILQKEIQKTIQEAQEVENLGELVKAFEEKLKKFNHGAAQLLFKMNKGPEKFLADATLFLEYCGILIMGWMWLHQAVTAQKALEKGNPDQDFYFGKLETARYFMEYEMIKIEGLLHRFHSNSYPTIDMNKNWF